MKHRNFRNTAIAFLTIAAIGTSVGHSSLTINSSHGPSAVATELRSLSKTDWAAANTNGFVSTSIGTFTRNDLSDNLVPFVSFLNPGTSLTISELFSCAGYTNELRIELGNMLLMTSKPDSNNENVLITSDSPLDTLEKLVFKTNTAGPFDPTAAGDVYLYSDKNLHTYVLTKGKTTNFIWALEDISENASRNDHDFNDYLFYAQISAVPEPSTVITAIAVGFLGLTILRRRFSKKDSTA
jgi:hypothetical protein